LKVIEFEPEHAGKLEFYIEAVDKHLKTDGDNPTIGLLLCQILFKSFNIWQFISSSLGSERCACIRNSIGLLFVFRYILQ